ncbi:MAG TPA: tripartite tricarboxylate transporter substrate binding protein [Pseudolabrys sp.]|jgi:tripartite-type tricarboxylate transporter receptor subunit TctC|uniref:tripartite tricarboxylate transporter substrate binding protein n=1 Tax=Pseudolabrys sp. TaxID=1960880 RepID=UPI002DDDA0D6|nr:tripartite tricarboxylate transporter substrate binding protein [Pseudolabrys sp.]HEV2627016.1 tripartite tricarboxylate transporter substrate binding protein [Pseudolabrys sp.]
MRTILAAAAVSVALATSLPAQAAWPDQTIKIIVPLPAGSAADTVARVISKELSVKLNQTVIVVNRPGASGEIGTSEVAKADPDGYTFGIATTTTLVTAPLLNTAKYDPVKDIAPVALIGTSPYVLVVNAKVPAQNLKEFIALAKKRPVTYSSVGEGSLAHLAASLFARTSGIKLTEVPYKSSTLAIVDLLSGRIDSQFGILTTTHQYIKEGKLRALGITSTKRVARFPDLPTLSEEGLPDFEALLWLGLIAPANTAQPIVQKVNAIINDMLGRPKEQELLANQAIYAAPMSPAEMRQMVEKEISKWKAVSQEDRRSK